MSAADLLGPRGPFALHIDHYEARTGQLEMAAAVERTLEADGILLCEAGTGTGKTFAYLVPALLSGRKVIISTATRALQDQIAERDLPLVQEVLGLRVDVAVMKGLGNYLCRRRYGEFLRSDEALRPGHARALELMRRFVKESETGDFAELATLEESSPVRHEVASSSETRVGPGCPHYDECFVTRMKRRAEEAQIVIVNHHLFFADLALRGPHPGRVLPDYDAAILDEAHQIEDIAALFFGVRVTQTQMARLLRDAARCLGRVSAFGGALGDVAARASNSGAPPPHASLGEFEVAGARFWEGLAEVEGEARVTLSKDHFTGPARELWHRLDGALEGLAATLASRVGDADDDIALRETLEQTSRRATTLRDQLALVIEGAPGRITWLDRSQKSFALSSTPVDLANPLRERLFESVPSVILTSATLSTRFLKSPEASSSGSDSASPANSKESLGFGFMRSRFGIDDDPMVRELIVASPFDYERQAVLYTPKDLPSPRHPEFLDAAADRVRALIEMTGGGAFILTTSVRSMRGLHQRLRGTVGDRALWVQGERPKNALLAAFRADGHGVLVATQSFWEGVDVPGSALRLVVLEKVPFAVPSDPLVQARSRALEDAGKSAFAHLTVPAAAIALKQGFGRLIRRADDVGVVALLDERIHHRGYGKRLLNALPPATRAFDLDTVRAATSRWRAR